MQVSRKSKALVASLATLGIVGVFGALTASGAASAEAAEATARVRAAQAQLSELEKNMTEVQDQQESERREGFAAFPLPAWAEFSAPVAFDEISAHAQGLKSSLNKGAVSKAQIDDGTLYWYEEGFFTSLMAIDWKCSWLSNGVAQVEAGDLDGAAETVEILQSFSSTDYAPSFPDYDEFLLDHVNPLLEGDVSGALQYLPNCGESTRLD